MIGVLLITQGGFLFQQRFLFTNPVKLESLRNDTVWSIIPQETRQFDETIHPGSGGFEPSDPLIERFFVSSQNSEKTRDFHHTEITRTGWKCTNKTPSSGVKLCDLPIEENQSCGAIYYKGNKELWLQIGPTKTRKYALQEQGYDPTRHKTTIILTLSYRKFQK